MKTLEILIAVSLLIFAIFLFYRSLRSKSQGKCDSCAAKCPSRDQAEGCENIVFLNKKA